MSNERYTRHAFDGDGMVCCFSFRDGRAWFKNKYVRTKGFVQEQVRSTVCCVFCVCMYTAKQQHSVRHMA